MTPFGVKAKDRMRGTVIYRQKKSRDSHKEKCLVERDVRSHVLLFILSTQLREVKNVKVKEKFLGRN